VQVQVELEVVLGRSDIDRVAGDAVHEARGWVSHQRHLVNCISGCEQKDKWKQ
jgi:hypothetical protein